MHISKGEAFGFVGMTAAVVGAGVSIYIGVKYHKALGKLDISLKDVQKMTTIEVDEELVRISTEEAVKKAVEKEVNEAAKAAVKAIRSDMDRDIKKAVEEAVKSVSDEIEKGVKEKYEKELSYIDTDQLVREIKKEAKEKMLKKFDGSLNGILDDYNDQLKNIGKIYSGISKTMETVAGK